MRPTPLRRDAVPDVPPRDRTGSFRLTGRDRIPNTTVSIFPTSRPHPQRHAAVDGHPESETVCPGPVRGLPAVPREHPVALAAEGARPPLIQIHYGLPLPRLEGHLITARISPCSR